MPRIGCAISSRSKSSTTHQDSLIATGSSTVTRDAALGSQQPIATVPLSIATVEDGAMRVYLLSGISLLIVIFRFAVERSSTQIRVFFWPRNSGSVPNEVRNGGTSVNPDNWVCNFNLRFTEDVVIFPLRAHLWPSSPTRPAT